MGLCVRLEEQSYKEIYRETFCFQCFVELTAQDFQRDFFSTIWPLKAFQSFKGLVLYGNILHLHKPNWNSMHKNK